MGGAAYNGCTAGLLIVLTCQVELVAIVGVDWVDSSMLRVLAEAVLGLSFFHCGFAMRIVIDIMIGLMLVAAVAGGLYLYNSRAQGERDIESVRVALQQLQEQATYHRTVQSAIADRDVLLVHVHAQWFGEDVPTNLLVSGDRPWIDLAPPGDLGEHPPDPVVQSERQASFWYNPTTGIFRARVSPASSEAQTLALYNNVNGTDLPGFEQIPDLSRLPLAHTPGTTPAKQYATMANKTWSEVPAKKAPPAIDLIKAEQQPETRAQVTDASATLDGDAGTRLEDQADHVPGETPYTDTETPAQKPESRPTLQNLNSD